MSTKALKGYWGEIQRQMVHQLAERRHLSALVVGWRRYNRNNRGLSYRVEDGHLVYQRYDRPCIDTSGQSDKSDTE